MKAKIGLALVASGCLAAAFALDVVVDTHDLPPAEFWGDTIIARVLGVAGIVIIGGLIAWPFLKNQGHD